MFLSPLTHQKPVAAESEADGPVLMNKDFFSTNSLLKYVKGSVIIKIKTLFLCIFILYQSVGLRKNKLVWFVRSDLARLSQKGDKTRDY